MTEGMDWKQRGEMDEKLQETDIRIARARRADFVSTLRGGEIVRAHANTSR